MRISVKTFLGVFFVFATLVSIVLFGIGVSELKSLEAYLGIKLLSFEVVFPSILNILFYGAVSGIFFYIDKLDTDVADIDYDIEAEEKSKVKLAQDSRWMQIQINELKNQIKELQESLQQQNDNNK